MTGVEKTADSQIPADVSVCPHGNGISGPTSRSGDVVAQLTKIWQELLGIQEIGPDQNWFDLGGDSIFAAKLFTRMNQEFKIHLPAASLFDAATIRQLAELVSRAISASK